MNNMNFNMYYNLNNNINNNMNNNLNNNISNYINDNKPLCYPNPFSNNYFNGNSSELNNITYSKNMIDNCKNKILNIIFINDRGTKIIVQIHSNYTIYQLIKKYMTILGLSEYDLRKGHLLFIHNTKSIDPFSNKLTREQFGDGASIYVLEAMNIIGGIN